MVVWLNSNGQISNQETVLETQNLSNGTQDKIAVVEEGLSRTKGTKPENDARRSAEVEVPIKRRVGDWAVFRYYALRLGPVGMLLFLTFMTIFVFFYGFPSIWVELWAEASGKRTAMYVGIYYALAVLQISFIVASAAYLLLYLVPRASLQFHRILVKVATNAPLTHLTRVDVGLTTNRFSQDLQLVDTELPVSFLNSTLALGSCIMQLVVICASAKYIAATVPFFVGILFIIQRFYMTTSRQIRLLDIAAKAPLLSHFIETLEGLSTIRAYGWRCFFEERTQELLGSSQKPFYGLYCVQRWLNLALDLSIASLTILLSGIVVAVRGSLNSGLVALALVNIISLNNNVRLLVIQWSQLETSIAAVARIREYELETPSEVRPEQEEAVLPDGWPRLGRVELRQASASYSA
ncbi:hypothetical protein AbraIFM66951_009158, partial [Aspergillus brasiliensis]